MGTVMSSHQLICQLTHKKQNKRKKYLTTKNTECSGIGG
jgi:hypothetical protein